VYSHGDLQRATAKTTSTEVAAPAANAEAIDPRLFTEIQLAPPTETIIAPSKTVQAHSLTNADEDAQTRGLAMHRCLELLTGDGRFSEQAIRQSLCEQLQLSPGDPLIDACLEEARQLIADPSLAHIFRPAEEIRVFNECPIHYQQDQQLIYGVIDRLLLSDREALIIDYKSHSQARPDNVAQLATAYQQQMQLYAAGIARAWPDRTVKAALLFTRCACLQPVTVA